MLISHKCKGLYTELSYFLYNPIEVKKMNLNKNIRNQAIIFGIITLFFSSQFFYTSINSRLQWKENEENNSIEAADTDAPILWSSEIGASISSLTISSLRSPHTILRIFCKAPP